MSLVINSPVRSCCGMPSGECRCRESKEEETLSNNDKRKILLKLQSLLESGPNTMESDEGIKNNIIPIETIDFAEEQAARIANQQSYVGKSPPPPSAQIEEPPPYQFHERLFGDILASNEPVAEEPKPYYQPSDGRLVANLPPVEGNIIEIPRIDWAAEARLRRHKV